MIDAEKIGLARELLTEDGYCHLNHGPTNEGRIQAVDYLVIPLGMSGKSSDELTIPICQDCLDGVNDSDWILLLCLNCIASQWVYKPKSKLSYIQKEFDHPYKGIILNGCLKCTKKLNGIWYIL